MPVKKVGKFYPGTELEGITIGSTVWAPVNCGYDATHTYGLLYQWGRKYGQAYESGILNLTAMAKDDDIESNKGKFGKYDSSTYNWFSGAVDNSLWSESGKGTSDPCPKGWRVPTKTELEALFGENNSPSLDEVNGQKGCWFNGTSSASSGVFLPAAGYRYYYVGAAYDRGDGGYYWSSSVSGVSAWLLYFSDDYAFMNYTNRAYGYSVRCVQE